MVIWVRGSLSVDLMRGVMLLGVVRNVAPEVTIWDVLIAQNIMLQMEFRPATAEQQSSV